MTEDGTQIFSANEISRLLCVEAGENGFIGGDPLPGALVDYWLEWEARELKVQGFTGFLNPVTFGASLMIRGVTSGFL